MPDVVEDQQPVRWGMGDGVLGIVVSIVLSAVVIAVAFGVAGIEGDESDTIPLWAVALLQVPLWAGLVGVPVLASRTKGRGSLREDFGFWMKPRDIWVGLLFGIAGQLALGVVLLPIYELLGIDRGKVGESAEKLADRANDPLGVFFLILVVVVGAAVFEELFYRGLWMRSMARRFGTVPAVLLSSVLFGSMHFQVVDTLALTGFGLIAGTLAARAGRLGPAIWCHMAFNATAVVSLLSG